MQPHHVYNVEFRGGNGASRAPRSDRRTVLRGLLAVGLITVGHPLITSAQESTPAALAPFVGETFVGRTSDPETLVAIVLGDEAGAEPRAARGYLCNGLLRTIDVWLTGEITGDQLTLTAEDGSRPDLRRLRRPGRSRGRPPP